MPRTFKTEAIVFKKNGLLNKDIIITFFSRELGKIRVLAKGIKKITSRRLPHTETGNLLKIVIYKKNERFFLQETQLLSAFSQIKNNQKKINFLYYFLFVLEKMLPENQKEEPIYILTKHYMIDLAKNNIEKDKITAYLNQLLFKLGYLHTNKSFYEINLLIQEIINEKIPSLII